MITEKEKKQILNLFQDCQFDGVLTEYDYEDKILLNLPDGFNYRCETGASKMVLLIPDCDYVIKIPFTGGYFEDDEEKYYQFCGAGNDDDDEKWNYCKIEEEKFIQAEINYVSSFFAKTECIGKIQNYPIYIQERATIFYDKNRGKDYSEERRSSTKEKCKKENFCCFDECWLTDLLEYCKNNNVESAFDDFMRFIGENQIGDLHRGNIGYINEKPVLVDYSDFWDD